MLSPQGNVSYSVKLDNGRVRKCQKDQLKARPVELSSPPTTAPIESPRAIPFEFETELP